MKMNFIKTLTLFLLVLGGVFFSTGLRAQLFSGTANGVYDMEVTSGTSLTISAIGADGGYRSFTNNPGGTGGTVEATFAVNTGDFIRVIIGKSGNSATNDGSGGGGTAVINCGSSLLNCENNLGTLLITAGAGGGAGINSNGGGATNVQGPGTNGNGQGNESASQSGCNIYSGVGNPPGPGFGYGGPGFGGFGGGGAGYTGGNGNPNRSGADGGSNYVDPSGTNVTNESGTDGGSTLSDGQVTINGSAVLDILSAFNCVETVVYDSDQDGLSDGDDNCPYVANPGQEDANGNGVGDVCEVVSDDDGDGVEDGDDLCANTPTGEGVNADGCSCSQVTVDDGDDCTLDECIDGVVTHTFQDADGDGVCDADDICPGGDDNVDVNGNGIPDFCDICPNGPNSNNVYVGNVTFLSQAEVDAWPFCYTSINGNLTIQGATINNLSALANLEEVTGNLTIKFVTAPNLNGLQSLESVGGTVSIIYNGMPFSSLAGLENLSSVGGNFYMYYNFGLNDCCAIHDLLSTNGVAGSVLIFFNKVGCNSASQILNGCSTPANLVGNHGQSFTPNSSDVVEMPQMKVFPNPANSLVNIQLKGMKGHPFITIADQLGRTVWSQQVEDGAFAVQFDLNNSPLQNGIYFVTVLSQGEKMTERLVIAR